MQTRILLCVALAALHTAVDGLPLSQLFTRERLANMYSIHFPAASAARSSPYAAEASSADPNEVLGQSQH